MNFIYIILQIIPFLMLVVIALGQMDQHLSAKISCLIFGKMKIRQDSSKDEKRGMLEKGRTK